MAIYFQPGYALPDGDQPLTHARIGHAGNWLAGGVADASDTLLGYFEGGPLNSLTYERWMPASLPAVWWYEHIADAEADYCGIAAHTAGSSGSTLVIEYFDGADWQVIMTVVPVDDAPIFCIFEPLVAQFWRVTVQDAECEIGVIRFGKALQMPRPIYSGHTPVDLARQTLLRSNYSETGEFLGRSRQRLQLATSYSWAHLTAPWVRANWPSLQRAVEAEPFFLAWRPQTFPEVTYCQTDAVPVPSNMGVRDMMQVGLSVRGLAYA